MTRLRKRLIEDMMVRNLAPATQATYVYQISMFARHFGRSPETLGREQIRSYLVYLAMEKELAASSIGTAVAALRFLYNVTLRKHWVLEDLIPTPKIPETLPVILSPEEVLQFLESVEHIQHRTILTACYAAGLRISEAVHLKLVDIDSQRMMIRIEKGKGQKDRYVMLSARLLEALRHWWRTERPQLWLFPGPRANKPITRQAVAKACLLAHHRSGLSKPVTPHSFRHYSESRTMPSDVRCGSRST
jgi:site-specific recombinase XerD